MTRCEQVNCAELFPSEDNNEVWLDGQYYCVKCDMELCPVCIFEHRTGTSLTGLKCDNEILRGGRHE